MDNIVVVESQIGHLIEGHPPHVVFVPVFCKEIFLAYQRVVRNVDDTPSWVPEDLAKRLKLLNHGGVFVSEQLFEHLAC